MNQLSNWLKKLWSPDRRKAERHEWPLLVAHYWTGAAPAAQRIRDISSTGFFLITEARWYPGTVVKITLQRTGDSEDDSDSLISVHSKVVRRDADGVGLEFVLPKNQEPHSEADPQDAVAVTDRKTLDRFLKRLRENKSDVQLDVE